MIDNGNNKPSEMQLPCPSSAHGAAQFGGFLKLSGDGCISEGKLMLPNDSGESNKRNARAAVAVGFTHAAPIVLPQLIAFAAILRQASRRLQSWLNTGTLLALHIDDITEELLALEHELKAARNEIMRGGDLARLLQSGRGGCSPAISAHHPLRTQVPAHLHVEVGIKEAELCVYVLSLALDPVPTGNRLVENVIEATGGTAIFRSMLKGPNKQGHGKIMSQVSTPDVGIGYQVQRVDLGVGSLVADRAGGGGGKDGADPFQVMSAVSFAQCSCKVPALLERLNAVNKAINSVRGLRSHYRQIRIANVPPL
jgi:hypothetical protein